MYCTIVSGNATFHLCTVRRNLARHSDVKIIEDFAERSIDSIYSSSELFAKIRLLHVYGTILITLVNSGCSQQEPICAYMSIAAIKDDYILRTSDFVVSNLIRRYALAKKNWLQEGF